MRVACADSVVKTSCGCACVCLRRSGPFFFLSLAAKPNQSRLVLYKSTGTRPTPQVGGGGGGGKKMARKKKERTFFRWSSYVVFSSTLCRTFTTMPLLLATLFLLISKARSQSYTSTTRDDVFGVTQQAKT